MRKLLTITLLASALFSCKPTEVVVPVSYEIDNYYILMADAFHLRPGMVYNEVKQVLKQDPYEIHQNIEDDCIILSYHMKRNERIHSNTEPEVPLNFYASADRTNLTYQGSKIFYLILDGEQKTLRTFFSDPNEDNIARYTMLLRRSKKVCENPNTSEDFMRLWTKNEIPAPTVELSIKSFLK